MNISKQGGCTWEDVAEFERSYQITFPPDYQEFLVKYNGGETPDTSFYFSRKLESDVRYFYGIGDVKYSVHNAVYAIDFDLPDMLEKGLFPIAEDSFGNTVLMDVKEHPGTVYFYDHEAWEENERLQKMTDSFKAFAKRCKSDKIDFYQATKPIAQREEELIARGYGDNITDGLRRIWQDEIDTFTGMVLEKVKLS